MRYGFNPYLSTWLSSVNQWTTSVGEDVEKREPSLFIVGGIENWFNHYGKQFLKKIKHRTTISPSTSSFGYLSKEIQNTNSKAQMHPYIHCSTIYNGQDIKQPKCPLIDKWVKKNSTIYNRILHNPKKEWDLAICNNVDGPRGCDAKWNKSDKDKCHMILLICGI